MDALWVSVGVTVVLVCITGYYAYQTKKIRQESLRPHLSLRTGLYTDSGGMFELILANTGAVARDVEIDIETNIEEKKYLFTPAIDATQEISLTYDLQEIRDKKGYVKVDLTFKDSKNHKLTETLNIDYKKLDTQEREIVFQNSPLIKKLEDIQICLAHIANKR